jgi:hypothetical protein
MPLPRLVHRLKKHLTWHSRRSSLWETPFWDTYLSPLTHATRIVSSVESTVLPGRLALWGTRVLQTLGTWAPRNKAIQRSCSPFPSWNQAQCLLHTLDNPKVVFSIACVAGAECCGGFGGVEGTLWTLSKLPSKHCFWVDCMLQLIVTKKQKQNCWTISFP